MGILAFTDGACSGNPGPGGWAAIFLQPDGTVEELGGAEAQTTNNRMELLAAIRLIEALKNEQNEIKIFTDSTYVIRGITEWASGWAQNGWKKRDGQAPENKDLWQELAGTSKNLKLSWLHIKGHAYYPGNERCDQIARAFSEGKKPKLFHGHERDYGINLHITPLTEALAQGDPYYLSYVNGKIFRDPDWKSCEARVKGQKNVKYKKCSGPAEEARILTTWGLRAEKK